MSKNTISNIKSIIVYDSYFGNTKEIAESIAKYLDTKAIHIKKFKNSWIEDLEFLVIGSPTRAFSPSEGMKNFLKTLPNLKGIKVATFDIRIELSEDFPIILKPFVKIFGYAAEPILKKLEKKGGEKVREPIGFYIEDTEGPLREGEEERAKAWIKD
jgi:flavodoxin